MTAFIRSAARALWGGAAALATAVAVPASDASASAGPAVAAPRALVVGVDYVVPPFVPGAKVRTPEGPSSLLVEDVVRRIKIPAHTVAAGNTASPAPPADFDFALLALADDAMRGSAQAQVIPTGYSSGAMAIMRTDTNIKKWADLKDRTVCVAEGGLYAGKIAARYGAIEHVHKAPADALLSLRTGGCDAAVHDSAMLDELLKLPEWKKFSARLPVQDRKTLAFVVPAGNKTMAPELKRASREWKSTAFLQKITKQAVADIAFEVYLDQTVTDCH
jgi:polar amino acid transport system substrate-binding protein